MADIDHIICDTPEQAARLLETVHRLSGLDGRAYPYTTPISPADRVGYNDGSTVVVEAITRAVPLVGGKVAVPCVPRVAALLATLPAKSAALGLATKDAAALVTLAAARRKLVAEESPKESEELVSPLPVTERTLEKR